MGLDIWFRDDIRNILLSARLAMLNSGGDAEYRRGFEVALVCIAQSFGIEPVNLDSKFLLGKMIPSIPERTM